MLSISVLVRDSVTVEKNMTKYDVEREGFVTLMQHSITEGSQSMNSRQKPGYRN